MTHTTFARRRAALREKQALARQHQHPLHHSMKTLFRILTCLALLITGALASLQYLTVLPPGTIPQDWIIKGAIAAVLLKGILEGITIVGDIADDGVRNGSFKPGASHLTRMLTMLLFVGMVSFMLASCVNDRFLGLDSQGWQKVMMNGGKQLGKEAPSAFLQAYAAEQNRPKTSAKQPINVQPEPDGLKPELPTAASPTQNFLTRWF